MKRILAGLIIAIAVQSAAFAQDGQRMRRTPEERAQHQVKMMEPLKLTEEQQKQVYDINLKLSATTTPDKGEEMMERAKEMQAKRASAYKEILNTDQYAAYEKMQAERREQMMRRMKENSAEGGID